MFSFFKKDLAEIIRAGLVLASLMALEPTKKVVIEKFEGISEFWGAMISTSLVFGALLVAVFILETLPARMALRNRFLKRCERIWAQKVTVLGRPYSISIIKYSKADGSWIYEGIAYDNHFKKQAEWHTTSIYFSEKHGDKREWFFSGKAWIYKHDAVNDLALLEDYDAYVHPILTLPEQCGRKIKGIVADVGVDKKRNLFDIELWPAKCDKSLNSKEDIGELKPAEVEELLQEAGVISS